MKFLTIYWNLYNIITFVLKASFKFVIDLIRFWTIFYKIGIHPKSLFTSLRHMPCIIFYAQAIGDLYILGAPCVFYNYGPLSRRFGVPSRLLKQVSSLEEKWGENSYNQPTYEEALAFGQSLLCKLREKSANCILIHCGKAQILWHLLPLQSFLSASLIQKGGLLGWHISFIGKKHKKGRNNCSFMLFFQAFDKRGIAKLLRIWSRLIKLWKSLLSDLYLSRFLTSLIVGE